MFLSSRTSIWGDILSDPNASFAFKIYSKFFAFDASFKWNLQIVGTSLLFKEVSFNSFSFNLSYSLLIVKPPLIVSSVNNGVNHEKWISGESYSFSKTCKTPPGKTVGHWAPTGAGNCSAISIKVPPSAKETSSTSNFSPVESTI